MSSIVKCEQSHIQLGMMLWTLSTGIDVEISVADRPSHISSSTLAIYKTQQLSRNKQRKAQ
ncbi:uncharacterized protein N7484_007152 [Penicillium longicatenatum]|uniref:uncharacterized protein n=1 Tax=Penicillium longicatenatum TaxID=1561947 RepID=UPI002547871E|nr:uncharacterized protein N7484_007152 [Penicillium longicatenatum]KAJ5639290.1 hypothetical protein N7484_007152 [Penicillium longicatenatum]